MLSWPTILKSCSLLLGAALALSSVAEAAKQTGNSTVRKSPVKVKTPASRMQSHGQKVTMVPRLSAQVYSSGNSGAKRLPGASKPGPLAESGINKSKVAARIDGRKLGELSALPQDKFKSVGQRLGTGQLDSQFLGANSGLRAGLDKVMPGFQTRGGKGASGLKDLAGTGGNHRNPVGGMMDQFTGGGAGYDGKGGGVQHHQDGSTTLRNKDGSTTDVWKDGAIVTRNKNGTTEVNRPNGQTDYYGKDGRKTHSEGGPRKIIDPNNPGYYTDGTKVEDSTDKGSKDKKQGSKKEPTPDESGETSSGPRYITRAELRGLGARRSAKGEPTGDEGTSGGTVDESRTREGRNGQRGEPIADNVTTSVPDTMQIKQALRIRLRNVTPVPEE